jgi:uncharacterized membrane protein
MSTEPHTTAVKTIPSITHHLRFHLPLAHLGTAFGNDWFGLKAEKFARFFGTPTFIICQTLIVALWIILNVAGVLHFDLYPFILLNLAFSLQAAYAAPLILLAQTRQADRDKAHSEADAQHREALATASQERLDLAANQTTLLLELLKQNTALTEMSVRLAEHVETLTAQVHAHLMSGQDQKPQV